MQLGNIDTHRIRSLIFVDIYHHMIKQASNLDEQNIYHHINQ